MVGMFHRLNALSLEGLPLEFNLLSTGAQQVPLNPAGGHHSVEVLWVKMTTQEILHSSK